MRSRVRSEATLSQVVRDHWVRNGSPNAERSRKGEPEVEPFCLVNDLRWERIPAVADLLHTRGYPAAESTASPERHDNAVRRVVMIVSQNTQAKRLPFWGRRPANGFRNSSMPPIIGSSLSFRPFSWPRPPHGPIRSASAAPPRKEQRPSRSKSPAASWTRKIARSWFLRSTQRR